MKYPYIVREHNIKIHMYTKMYDKESYWNSERNFYDLQLYFFLWFVHVASRRLKRIMFKMRPSHPCCLSPAATLWPSDCLLCFLFIHLVIFFIREYLWSFGIVYENEVISFSHNRISIWKHSLTVGFFHTLTYTHYTCIMY